MTNYSKEEIERVRQSHPLEKYLPSRGFELRKSGQELVCKCPFHPDGTPSFCVNPTKQVWTCRAGCGGGDVFAFVQKLDGIGFTDAVEKMGGHPLASPDSVERPRTASRATPGPKGTKTALPPPAATYDYVDSAGKLVMQALRYQLDGGKKTFRQRRPNGQGGWQWDLDGIEPVLYRLPEVLASEFVWNLEGEKDADNVAQFGLTATCNPMGAGKWRESYTAALKGKSVILCGDNDEPGERHMDEVEKALSPVVRSLRRVRVPAPHKDVSDSWRRP